MKSYAHPEAKNNEGQFICPVCKKELDIDTIAKIVVPYKDKYAIYHKLCLEKGGGSHGE